MKEEDLSRIKQYPIVEYLERKGIKPVRRTPSYALYRSPLREETHPSFKVDTQKNLWIDYAEGRGGSIIDLCMRMESSTLSEAIRRLGQNAPDNGTYSSRNGFASNNPQPVMVANGARRLIEISDTLPPHLQEYLARERCIDLEKSMPFLKCITYIHRQDNKPNTANLCVRGIYGFSFFSFNERRSNKCLPCAKLREQYRQSNSVYECAGNIFHSYLP